MRHSLYWDDFEKRAEETARLISDSCLGQGDKHIPIRRAAVFVTSKCNMKCAYCNHVVSDSEMTEKEFQSIINWVGKHSIIHITGGEPSVVNWLYPYLRQHGEKYRFHLNTNAFIMPPYKSIKRLKVSLDSCDRDYWNKLTGTSAFDTVVDNVKRCLGNTVVSITHTMTRENYRNIPEFISFVKKEFPSLYAIYFSVYKGTNERFVMSDSDVSEFFDKIKPIMDSTLDEESRALMNETLEEKFRIMRGVRFPENDVNEECYLSCSERVFFPGGKMSGCSHLARDGVFNVPGQKHEKCKYGCNRRLVAFNQSVKDRLLKLRGVS